jgi:hypothetical protein
MWENQCHKPTTWDDGYNPFIMIFRPLLLLKCKSYSHEPAWIGWDRGILYGSDVGVNAYVFHLWGWHQQKI